MRFTGRIEAPYGNADHVDEIGAKRSALAEYLGMSGKEVIADYQLRFLKALQSKILELVKDGTDVSRSRVLVQFLQDDLSSHKITMEEFDEYKKAASSIVNMRSFELDWHSQESIARTASHFKKMTVSDDCGDIQFDFENDVPHGRSR